MYLIAEDICVLITEIICIQLPRSYVFSRRAHLYLMAEVSCGWCFRWVAFFVALTFIAFMTMFIGDTAGMNAEDMYTTLSVCVDACVQ